MEISSQSEVRRGLDGNYKRKVEKFSGFQAVNDESDMLQQMGRELERFVLASLFVILMYALNTNWQFRRSREAHGNVCDDVMP